MIFYETLYRVLKNEVAEELRDNGINEPSEDQIGAVVLKTLMHQYPAEKQG